MEQPRDAFRAVDCHESVLNNCGTREQLRISTYSQDLLAFHLQCLPGDLPVSRSTRQEDRKRYPLKLNRGRTLSGLVRGLNESTPTIHLLPMSWMMLRKHTPPERTNKVRRLDSFITGPGCHYRCIMYNRYSSNHTTTCSRKLRGQPTIFHSRPSMSSSSSQQVGILPRGGVITGNGAESATEEQYSKWKV